MLPAGSPASLFWSLDVEGIWPLEENLAVEKSLGDSEHKPCFTRAGIDTFAEANTRSYLLTKATKLIDPERLLLNMEICGRLYLLRR